MKKKRILCGLLTLAMLMALLTVTAFAEEAALPLPAEGGKLVASGTYQLSGNLTISSPLEIPKDSEITIDLNGHTLNTPAAGYGVLVRGTCTIVDRAENGTINASGTAIVNAPGAELTISNATVSSSFGPVLQNQGTVTIQGAKLSSNVAAGIFNLDGIVTVSDSTIYGNDNGILNGFEGVDGKPSIIISNSTVSSNASYAVNNNLPGSSLTATKTNFIARKRYVIRNAGTLDIDAASSLTNSNSPIPGKIFEDASIDVLLPAGKSWQEVVKTQPDSYEKEGKTLKISSPQALAWWAARIKSGESFAGYTITISGPLDMSDHLWEPIDAWGEPEKNFDPLDGVTIQGQGQDGVIRNLLIRGYCSTIDGYPYACGFIGIGISPYCSTISTNRQIHWLDKRFDYSQGPYI